MAGDLDELARAAADALVSAMVTDSWEVIKSRFAALIGGERRMDAARAELAAKSGPDRGQALQAQAWAWSTRLRDALDDDPGTAEGLRALITELSMTSALATPASQYAHADHESQAVNVGGNISGNTGDAHVGVGKVDRRKVNIALAPFMFLVRVTNKTMAAHPAATAASAVFVVLAVAAVSGWQAQWPAAVFGRTAAKTPTGTASKAVPGALPKVMTWTATQAPLPANAAPQASSTGYSTLLSGIACPAAGACVATGWYTDSNGHTDSFIESASHSGWGQAAVLPGAAGTYTDAVVYDVACSAPGVCTAVGDYLDNNSALFAGLIYTLSGGAWMPSSVSSLPAAAGRDRNIGLDAIACPSAGTCVAVGNNWYSSSGAVQTEGQPLTEMLSNGAWTAAGAPLPADAAQSNDDANLYGVACPTSSSCIAVGTYTDTNSNTQGVIETLANGTWTAAKAPLPHGGTGLQELNYIACPAPGSCVAVGAYSATNGITQGVIETLANGAWTATQAPLPAGANPQSGANLKGITCPARGSCVAVGDYVTDRSSNASQGMIEILANGAWTAATAPLPANAGKTSEAATLFAVACGSARSCTATGVYTDTSKHQLALIEATASAGKP